jgi:hypothetical protein
MRARVGKIARLPGAIRDTLNRRLNNGALGKDLVPWLNALPEVKHVLATRFASRPITHDNLSEWRRGGFQDWLLQEGRRVRLRELSDQCPERDPAMRARRIAAYTEEQLALEIAEELERLSAITDRTERSKCLQRLSQELCRLQNSHLRNRELRLLEAKAARAQTAPGMARVPHTAGNVRPPSSFHHLKSALEITNATHATNDHAIVHKSHASRAQSRPDRGFSGLFGPKTYGGEGQIAIDKKIGKAEHSATLQNE